VEPVEPVEGIFVGPLTVRINLAHIACVRRKPPSSTGELARIKEPETTVGIEPDTALRTMPRQTVEIANPRRYGQTHTSFAQAMRYASRGIAYFLEDGRLKFVASQRRRSTRRSRGEHYAIAVVDRWTDPHTQWFKDAGEIRR
jgi:hypothetical protein